MSNEHKTKADLETELAVSEESKKIQKLSINSAAKEFMCPICLELPVEPVTASDGRVYNRADIQRHIDTAKKEGREVLSPVTKEKLKEELLPAVQVANTIRSLIESGAVEGELADQWKKADRFRSDAEKGDSEAMCNLAACYRGGTNGFMRDYEKAYHWYEKAADLGHADGTAMQGFLLVMGEGVAQEPIYGMALLTMAADTMGSVPGAFIMVQICADGFPKNMKMARKMAKIWLKKTTENSKLPGARPLSPSDEKALENVLAKLEK